MGKGRDLIPEGVRKTTDRSYDRHRKHAHDLERLAPGAGEMHLRRLQATLDGLLEAELRRLRTLHDGEPR